MRRRDPSGHVARPGAVRPRQGPGQPEGVSQRTPRRLPPLFPESSKNAEKTDALPAIWENKAKFDTIFDEASHGCRDGPRYDQGRGLVQGGDAEGACRIAAPAITTFARRALKFDSYNAGGLVAARFIWRSGDAEGDAWVLSVLALVGALGFCGPDLSDGLCAHPRRRSRPRSCRIQPARSRERPHPVLCRRLHLLPCGAQSGRQAAARRRLCPEIAVRHLSRSRTSRPTSRTASAPGRTEDFVRAMREGISPEGATTTRPFPIRPISG